MRKDRPSRMALKVALNIVTLGSKPGMEAILPAGIVDATRKLLVASGAAVERTVNWSQSQRSVAIYESYCRLLQLTCTLENPKLSGMFSSNT